MSLVEGALKRSPEEREAFIQCECGDDSELLEQVRNYVHWEETMDRFLLEPFCLPPEPPFEEGEKLADRFRILKVVGEGGMGIVYEAWDERRGERVALKCAKAGFDSRLPPEVRFAGKIGHRNVCNIHDIHTASTPDGPIEFFTMEFLEGETQADRLRRGTLSKEEAQGIALQICAGLAEAHRHGVVHGDLKSNNVILVKDSAHGAIRPVITDFGLARGLVHHEAGGAQLDALDSAPAGGALEYMAPELRQGGKATFASDVYALGVILFELASGRRPFGTETPLEERPLRSPPAVYRKWDPIIKQCLDSNPARRFRDARAVEDKLKPSVVRPWMLAAAAVLTIIVGVSIYYAAEPPTETVRLALLPSSPDTESTPLTDGLLIDTGNRLSHLKTKRARWLPGVLNRRLTVIPLDDAIQHKVNDAGRARTVLGATYALRLELRKNGELTNVWAHLIDTRSGHEQDWKFDSKVTNSWQSLPLALAGDVTNTLSLPPVAAVPTVNAAAFPDYAAGVALARTNPGVNDALLRLQRAVELDPNSPLTHAKLAEVQWLKYTLTKDTEWQKRALSSLQNAEQLNPDVPDVRFVAAIIQDYFGHYDQALTDLERARYLDPNNGDIWRLLGQVHEDMGHAKEALDAYNTAIEVQPQYFKNYQRLGAFYFDQGDYEKAVEQRKKTVELAPDLADAHYALAAPYLNMARYAEAEYELNLAISKQRTADAVLGLGLSRLYQGRNREAIPFFEEAIVIGPATSLYYVNLGTAWRRYGSIAESNRAYKKGLEVANTEVERNPSDAYERSLLAYLCARLGDQSCARFEIHQALDFSKKFAVRWMAINTYEVLEEHNHTLELLQDIPPSIFLRIRRSQDLVELQADPRFQQLLVDRHIQ